MLLSSINIDVIRHFNEKSYSLNDILLSSIHYLCNISRNDYHQMEVTKEKIDRLSYLCMERKKILMEKEKDINRIKVVLVEKKRTNKWLAEQLGKDPATVSKWCTNTSQPGLETLLEIARVLDVDIKELLNSTRDDVQLVRIQKQ